MNPWRTFRFALILAMAPVLAGCAVADLVAHGVKTVEKRNQGGAGENQSSAPPSAAQPQADEPPPPARAPAPQRSAVTVEELPAR